MQAEMRDISSVTFNTVRRRWAEHLFQGVYVWSSELFEGVEKLIERLKGFRKNIVVTAVSAQRSEHRRGLSKKECTRCVNMTRTVVSSMLSDGS